MRIGLVAVVAAFLLGACTPAAADPTPTGPSAGSPTPTAVGSPLPSSSPAVSPPIPTTSAPGTVATRATSPAPVGAFVLGDSISLSIAPDLSRLGYPVVGRVGQSATDAYLAEHLSSAQAQVAPAWVIVLGTNNVGDPRDIAGLDRLLDLIDRLRRTDAPQSVYWVSPYRPPAYTGGLSGTTLDAFDVELARQATKRPWLHVVDFAAVAALHQDWFAADGAHLHPDEDGRGVLVALIAGPDASPAAIPAPIRTLDSPGIASDGDQAAATRPTTPRSTPAPALPTPAASPDGSTPEPVTTAAPSESVPEPATDSAQPEFSPGG